MGGSKWVTLWMVGADGKHHKVGRITKKQQQALIEAQERTGKLNNMMNMKRDVVVQEDQRFVLTVPKKFHSALQNAKDKQDKDKAWRVDVHDERDYRFDKLYVSKNGSTIAVTPDGDIISVCKNPGDMPGKEILALAVKQGGKKLDSYGGNHSFYRACGFEPVSWCEWDDRYAPPGWNPKKHKREPIIFYKYTGNKVKVDNETEFTSRVPASKDYDTAMNIRDEQL